MKPKCVEKRVFRERETDRERKRVTERARESERESLATSVPCAPGLSQANVLTIG